MIRIPVPFEHHFAGINDAKFDVGTRFTDERGELLALVRIPERYRQVGLGRLAFNAFHRDFHEIEMLVQGRCELTASLARGWFGAHEFPLSGAAGEPRGRMNLQTSILRVPVSQDRVIVHDEHDRELGWFEFDSKLTTTVTKVEDVAAGQSYVFERHPGPAPSSAETPLERVKRYLTVPALLYPKGDARDIDARFLMAIAYYFDYYRDLGGPNPL